MGKIINALLGGIWGYIAVGVVSVLLSGLATGYLVRNTYEIKISNLKLSAANQSAADATAALDKLETYIGRIHTAQTDYQYSLTHIQSLFDDLKGQFNALKKLKPLPLDCKPDTDRLRILGSAVTQTNAAIAPGSR